MTAMFNNLLEKNEPTHPVFPTDNFSILKMEIDEVFALATINKAYDNYPNKKFFPYWAQVELVLKEKDSNGLPTSEESEVLNNIEDKIVEFLKQKHTVHFIGRISRTGFRDIIFYLDKPNFDQETTQKFFDEINAIRALDFYIEKDPEWEHVSAFIG